MKIVHEMKIPETKTELRQMLGFFAYFQEHILAFSNVAKLLTDLTAKHVSTKILWAHCNSERSRS